MIFIHFHCFSWNAYLCNTQCSNGIYPGVRDFIVYFGGHLHVIKASYTEYVKIY